MESASAAAVAEGVVVEQEADEGSALRQTAEAPSAETDLPAAVQEAEASSLSWVGAKEAMAEPVPEIAEGEEEHLASRGLLPGGSLPTFGKPAPVKAGA